VNDCEVEFRSAKDDILYCKGGIYNYTYCVLTSRADNSTTTNCTEPTGTCPSGYFLFEDNTCKKVCPNKFTPYVNATCSSPCGLNNALYPNGSCLQSCIGDFKTRMEGNFMFCDEIPPVTNGSSSYTAILELYIRYNITLTDFYNQNGLIKFLKLLAELLGIDISQIIISDIREGSTIIETKVAITSDSDSKSKASANSKVKEMSEKFENAAQANNLNLEGIKVLNHRSSMVIPDRDNIKVEESSSSVVAIAAGVGVGLAVLALGIIAYSVYRRKQKLKMRRVTKIAAHQVEANPVANQQEEFNGLPLNSIIQIKENTKNRIEPEPIEKVEEEEEKFKPNGPQEEKVFSLNEIMNRIEAEANAEIPIELNFVEN